MEQAEETALQRLLSSGVETPLSRVLLNQRMKEFLRKRMERRNADGNAASVANEAVDKDGNVLVANEAGYEDGHVLVANEAGYEDGNVLVANEAGYEDGNVSVANEAGYADGNGNVISVANEACYEPMLCHDYSIARHENLYSGADVNDSSINIMSNIKKCYEVIEAIPRINDSFASIFSSGNAIFHLEDALLGVASSQSADGVFYTCVIANDQFTMARYFQYGAFEGFFRGKVYGKMMAEMGDVFPWSSYCSLDVKKNRTFRYGKDDSSEIPNLYKRNLLSNKYSVAHVTPQVVQLLENSSHRLVLLIIAVFHKRQKFDTSKLANSSPGERFYYCNDENFNWWKELVNFRISNDGAIPEADLFTPVSEDDTLEQAFFISAIPNLHYWRWNNEDSVVKVRHVQKFSFPTKYRPASPRTRIIQACLHYEDEAEKMTMVCIGNVLGENGEHVYKRKRKMCDRINYTKKKNVLEPVDVHVSGMQVEEIPQPQISLYAYFCGEVFRKGIFSWRLIEQNRQVVVCNTYDPSTGQVKESDYVHICATKKSNGDFEICCECSVYKSCQSVNTSPEGITCLHCRLMGDILDENLSSNYVNKQVVKTGRTHVSQKVLHLGGRANVDRYSIEAEDKPEIVTLFKVEKSNRTVVSCHSGLCAINRGNKRIYENLGTDDANICGHLKEFAKFHKIPEVQIQMEEVDDYGETLPEDKWREAFDEATGLWTFHKDSPSASVHVKEWEDVASNIKHWIKCRRMISLQDENSWPSFIPNSNGTCQCGDEWKESQVIFAETTSLYLNEFVITPKVYSRVCPQKKCTKEWTGEDEFVYRLSKYTCAGWEIGYSFVDHMNTAPNTFSGFVEIMNKAYQRYEEESRLFMSTPTFLNWWFSWASAMRIDFREPCASCNAEDLTLVCDGTKIGASFKNTFVSPIERAENGNTKLCTQLRRLDRCFLSNENKFTKQEYKNARLILTEDYVYRLIS